VINLEEEDSQLESESELLGLVLFGIDPTNYLSMFSGNIKILNGEFLKREEKGILLQEN